MAISSYKMTEEVVRWRFELQLINVTDWQIAFTNPTAGPWKRLMGWNESGEKGEVYRFSQDEDRPDVVAVNDKLRLVMIVEAKDKASCLGVEKQVIKSSTVVASLATALTGREDNPFWGNRAKYNVVAGLLWGRPFGGNEVDVASLFKLYRAHLRDVPLVGFETVQQASGELSIREFAENKHRFNSPLLS